MPPAANNWGHLSDPDYDGLIERGSQEFDPAGQARLLSELHARVVDDAMFLFVARELNPRAMTPRVQGFMQAQSGFQDLTPLRLA